MPLVSITTAARELLCRQRLLILGRVDLFPVAFDDPRANLGSALPFAGLLERVEVFVDASAAPRTVLAGEAVQQAGVAMAAVAMAIAGLLVEGLFDFGCDGVRVLHDGFREKGRIHCRWQFFLRGLGMIGRHRLIS